MKRKHIHFIGVKGVGMTALAIYVKEKGYDVTGSDLEEEFVTDEMLKKFNIPVKTGFNSKEITKKPDLAIVTGAHGGMTNPEAADLAMQGVEVITHGEAVGRFMEGSFGISVAGVGGKTTTSAMAATFLTHAGLDPSYVVGVGSINPLNQPGHFGKSKYFIAEADEYACCPLTNRKPRFLYQHPQIEIITNIDFDHPDIYASITDTQAAFHAFSENMVKDGIVILYNDNSNNRLFKKNLNKKNSSTYGITHDADYQIDNIKFLENKTRFSLKNNNLKLGDFEISVPGKFNILNATAVAVMGIHLGFSVNKIQKLLPEFYGTKRRFEILYNRNQIRLIDDYAHHPNEIKMTLMAAKQWYPENKITCIFQPHTYSRTKALLGDFAQAFGFADEVIILPIFASARENEDKTINSPLLVTQISKFHQNVFYAENKEILLKMLQKRMKKNTVIFTMGAGDVYKLDADIINILK